MDWVDVEMELSAGGREDLAAWVHDNAVNCRAMADLLATIHRDGGHHAAMVGIAQSCKDAEHVVLELRRAKAEKT